MCLQRQVAPPDTSSSGEILLQDPSYRTVLVNASTAGVRFYQLNAEQDFGEDMGFADAFFLWVMSAFDDAHGLEAYLRAHDAPEAWFEQVTPMFESWRAPGS